VSILQVSCSSVCAVIGGTKHVGTAAAKGSVHAHTWCIKQGVMCVCIR
jgi:hypothetical protein